MQQTFVHALSILGRHDCIDRRPMCSLQAFSMASPRLSRSPNLYRAGSDIVTREGGWWVGWMTAAQSMRAWRVCAASRCSSPPPMPLTRSLSERAPRSQVRAGLALSIRSACRLAGSESCGVCVGVGVSVRAQVATLASHHAVLSKVRTRGTCTVADLQMLFTAGCHPRSLFCEC